MRNQAHHKLSQNGAPWYKGARDPRKLEQDNRSTTDRHAQREAEVERADEIAAYRK